MTSTGSYSYSHRDLLSERYHYMYTPYEGPDLLRAFLGDRQSFLDRLTRASSPAAPNAENTALRLAIHGRELAVLPASPREKSFDTLSVLLDLWQCELDGPDDLRDLARQWETVLLGRYEITKRLYVRYTATLRAESDDWSPLEPYALLSALLARRYAEDGNLKFLNAMLKLNDLLSSAHAEEHSPLTVEGALAAAESEAAAMAALLAAQKVAL